MTKVSAIACFYKQKETKPKVIMSLKHQVDQLIIVEDKGNLTEQRELGLTKAKHEYILFCDGDIVVEEGFVALAKKTLDTCREIGVVGGRVTTPCKTPAQELMNLLRHRAYYGKNNPNGCFMARKDIFTRSGRFGNPPHEDSLFYGYVKNQGYRVHKIDKELLHIGEPETITALLQRQCKYGNKEAFDLCSVISFALFPISAGIAFNLVYGKYYRMERRRYKCSMVDLTDLFCAFMATYHWSTIAKETFRSD